MTEKAGWIPFVGKAAIGLGLVAYAAMFGELFIRLMDPRPIMPRYVTGTPAGVRGNIANARYRHETPEVSVAMRINGEGMRDDREFAFEKKPGTCRVELFGDSFFMGYELDLKDTFAIRLEEGLRARGIDAEVLNLAVSGFGTAEMLQSFERYGRRFSPDLVLFSWHSSDYFDNARANLFAVENGALVRRNDTFLPSVRAQDRLMKWRLYRLLADHSQLYNVVRERASGLIRSAADLIGRRRRDEEPQKGGSELAFLADPYAIQLSSLLLQRAQADVRADKADFLVVEIPFRLGKTTLRETTSLLPPELWRDVPKVSPLPAFEDAVRHGRKIFYERGAGHVTPLGSELLTNAVLDAVLKRDDFASCRDGNARSARG